MKGSVILFLFLAFSPIFVFAQPKYEFRGVWIATVDNIDWPVRNMTDPENQKADFIRQQVFVFSKSKKFRGKLLPIPKLFR